MKIISHIEIAKLPSTSIEEVDKLIDRSIELIDEQENKLKALHEIKLEKMLGRNIKMNFDIKGYNKDNKELSNMYIEENYDKLEQEIELAKKDYPQELIEELDDIEDTYLQKKNILNAWFDKYMVMVKGSGEGKSFTPNTNSFNSVYKKMSKELGGGVINGRLFVKGDGYIDLSNPNYYDNNSKDELLKRVKVGELSAKIEIIRNAQWKYFIENDNYEVKSRAMHDFMWEWNIDFNNKLFNKQLVDDETLEECWLFYQEIKKELESVNKKVLEFRERGEK